MQEAHKAMVFGVFDTLHPGHRYFLAQARARARELVVVVTVPEMVELLKKKTPKHSLQARMRAIEEFDPGLMVIEGDRTLGSWHVLAQHAPDRVYLGHDQQGIARELSRLGIAYEFIDAYFPEIFKSSLL